MFIHLFRSAVKFSLFIYFFFQICCSEHTYEGHYSRCTSRTEAQGDNIGVCKGNSMYNRLIC